MRVAMAAFRAFGAYHETLAVYWFECRNQKVTNRIASRALLFSSWPREKERGSNPNIRKCCIR